MGDNMKKKNSIRILSSVMSLVIVLGLLSPMTVNATSDDAYIKGMQTFFDDGSHAQLIDCPQAVYMEYAETLRKPLKGGILTLLLGFMYEGFDCAEKIEPNKERYKETLLNIIRTYEEENAAALTQQNQMDDTKTLEDYLHDVADMGLDWLDIGATNIELKTGKEALPENISIAVSIINQLPKDSEDWTKGAATLKTTLQLFEKYDTFLRAIEKNSTGKLKEAASELRADQTQVVNARLRAFKDLSLDSAEDYAKLFVSGIWSKDWISWLDAAVPAIGNRIDKLFIKFSGQSSGLTGFQKFQAAKLGVAIGQLGGNLLVSAEDILAYIVEIKAVHDISIALETEMEAIMGKFQANSSAITKADAQNYIECGNYLISCRIRGQYCMTAIYLHPTIIPICSEEDAKNAEALYNRLSNNLLDIKKKLDAICSGTSPSLVLSGIDADTIQYYNCTYSGNFAVIGKDGKYGIIGYDGQMIVPMEYDEIIQGRNHGYDYLWADGYMVDENGHVDTDGQQGWPGGDVDPKAYWYNDKLVVAFPFSYANEEVILGGIEELEWVYIEQLPWKKGAVMPIQALIDIEQDQWGNQVAITDNKAFALLDTTTGELISDFIYSGFDTGNGFKEGVLAVKKGDKWGFIDETGKELTAFLYDAYAQHDSYEGPEYKYSIFSAVNGYIAVLQNGKWGLIDTEGNVVVETAYDGISQVNPDGMFWLKENGSWSLYKLNG